MKAGTETKLKFKQLQRRLNLPLWQARGLLDTLWNFVAHNCPRGDIGRFSADEIAAGIDYQENAQELLETLVSVRWLDRDESLGLVVHDWPDHCEDGVHKALIKGVEVFADGRLPSLARIETSKRPQILKQYELKYGKEAVKNGRTPKNARERSETPKNAPTMPSLALPSHTKPSPTYLPASVENHEPTPNEPASEPPPIEPGRQAGRQAGRQDHVLTWEAVGARLAAIPDFDQWPAAIKAAKECNCTPSVAHWLIDHAEQHGYGPGAIYARFKIADPLLALNRGWPNTERPDQVARKRETAQQAKAEKAQQQAQAEESRKAAERETSERLEREFGGTFDAMPDEELAELIGAANPLLKVFQRSGRTQFVREWSLSQLAKLRSVQ